MKIKNLTALVTLVLLPVYLQNSTAVSQASQAKTKNNLGPMAPRPTESPSPESTAISTPRPLPTWTPWPTPRPTPWPSPTARPSPVPTVVPLPTPIKTATPRPQPTPVADIRMKVIKQTTFKRYAEDSSGLPSTDKCSLFPIILGLESHPKAAAGKHFKVELSYALEGCSFTEGYVFGEHVEFPDTEIEPIPDLGNYTFPLRNGEYGSSWCVCRDVGTSPHIGQDLVKYGELTSVALNNGVVESITYDSSCGYGLFLRDAGGALWRYLHLNEPYLSEGDRVESGQVLGTHSNYPTSSCGTGPHLHLERRSAGAFDDAPQGRSCQYGYSECNYDPNAPWRSFQAAGDKFENKFRSSLKKGSFAAVKETSTGIGCSPMQPTPVLADQSIINSIPVQSESFKISARILKSKSGKSKIDLAVKNAVDSNSKNCTVGKNCITAWDAYVYRNDGKLVRLFSDNTVNSMQVNLDQKTNFCLPNDASAKFVVTLQTSLSGRMRLEGTFK